jgi:uncharacterized RmlC-like cupin family protein
MEDLLGCRLLPLERHGGERGTLTVLLGAGGADLTPRRAFLLTDVAPGASRGGHAHREAQQLIVVVAGEVDAVVADGRSERVVRLVAGGPALTVPPLVRLTLTGFTPDAAVLVLGSDEHGDDSFVHDDDELRALRGRRAP